MTCITPLATKAKPNTAGRRHWGAGRVVVGTAARHYELGPVALALVKRSVPDDAVLRVGPSTAAIDQGRA